jgi:hypothetical protein
LSVDISFQQRIGLLTSGDLSGPAAPAAVHTDITIPKFSGVAADLHIRGIQLLAEEPPERGVEQGAAVRKTPVRFYARLTRVFTGRGSSRILTDRLDLTSRGSTRM